MFNPHLQAHFFPPMTIRDVFFSDPFFRDTWHDFDALHNAMLEQTRQHWGNRVEEDQRKAIADSKKKDDKGKGTVAKTDEKEDSSAAAPWFFPRRWLLPSLLGEGEEGHVDKTMKTLDLFQQLGDDHVIRLTNDDAKFEVSLDTHGFKPEELKVKVEGGQLMVVGKHEVKEEGKYSCREFHRRYALPKECQMEAIKSNLSSDGILVITAPKKALTDESGKAIPIEMAAAVAAQK